MGDGRFPRRSPAMNVWRHIWHLQTASFRQIACDFARRKIATPRATPGPHASCANASPDEKRLRFRQHFHGCSFKSSPSLLPVRAIAAHPRKRCSTNTGGAAQTARPARSARCEFAVGRPTTPLAARIFHFCLLRRRSRRRAAQAFPRLATIPSRLRKISLTYTNPFVL